MNKQRELVNEGEKIYIRVNESLTHEIDLAEIPRREVVYHWKSKYFRREIEQNLAVKFISMGKILNDKDEISDLHLQPGQVIQAYVVEEVPPEQNASVTVPIDLEAQQIQNIHMNLANAMQDILNQQEQGSFWEFLIGMFVGFVLLIFALMGVCITPCSLRAKQGIMLGFVVRLVYVQIQLVYSTK